VVVHIISIAIVVLTDTAWFRSFDMGLTSAGGQNQKCLS
jgi:hypothetical protein